MFETITRATRTRSSLQYNAQRRQGFAVAVVVLCLSATFPSVGSATHEADHRFTVEGFVCGADGKALANTDVLIKDTKISYGQVVKTDGDGYYRATFHLHNENLGDPLLVEAKGEQQHHKVQFDPKDLESERKVQIHFGTGCVYDASGPPAWLWWGLGGTAAVVAGAVGVKRIVRAQRKQGQKRGKAQGKRKH
ncbi:MAG TPA: carboxypeptidase-like regulatory domain-containing protein [Bryobacteraceae bacterium]